jgi:hypothetical protein
MPFKKIISKNIKSKSKIKNKSKKPDYLDLDKDGDKKEPMKKALKDKKNPTKKPIKKVLKKKKTLAKESFDNYITDLLKESMGLNELDAMDLNAMNDIGSHEHNDPDESEFPTKLKELKKGEYFKRNPDSKKVWIKGDHVRFHKKGKIIIRYSCTAADDMNQEIFLNPLAPVYTEFEY